MTTTFSVVTISYNQAEFLPEAMESVMAQQGVELEYIVCDPGSTDGSREIIRSYDDPRVRPIFESDDGPADGLNKGFAEARGDIFYYLNADDRVHPGAFVAMAAFFERHPDVDVACGHAEVIDRQGLMIRRVWSEPFTRYAVATGAHVQIQPATFVRSATFRAAGGFDVHDRSNWDGSLLTSLHLTGARIAIVDEFLGSYRLHPASITMSGARAEQHRQYADRNFERLMGRPPQQRDRVAGFALRSFKHLRHPHRTLERVRKGPLFGST